MSDVMKIMKPGLKEVGQKVKVGECDELER